jgi:hypothetical protein
LPQADDAGTICVIVAGENRGIPISAMRLETQSDLSLEARTLWRAADAIGGFHALARLLHAPSQELESWLLGRERIPQGVFLRAVDFVIADQEQRDRLPAGPAARP